MASPNKHERWRQALEDRNTKRESLRVKAFEGTPLAPTKTTVTAIDPNAQMMVRRGNAVMPISHQQATNTTAKSWAARKQTYGKVGRVSKNTFKKKA
jgi:hypothetical protein